MEQGIDWGKVIGPAIFIPYWGFLVCFIGWISYKALRRDLFVAKYFPRFYRTVIWKQRTDSFLKGIGALAIFFGLILLLGWIARYLDFPIGTVDNQSSPW